MQNLYANEPAKTPAFISCGSPVTFSAAIPLTPTSRFWRRWTLNALNWSDIVCQPCVATWTHPTALPALREAA